MILPKLIHYFLLSCLISIVFTQTEILSSSAIEPNVTATSSTISGTQSTTMIVPTASPSSISNSTITTSSSISNITTSTTATSNIMPTSTMNNADAFPTVQTPGWNSNGNNEDTNQQSWLRQHNRFVFVIFLGLLFMAILIWYIVRSVKGMRKRLEQENEAQLYMMQQARSPPPLQQQQRNDRVIPESTTPPPIYKEADSSPLQPVNNNGQY
ncbi:hypothetical protein BD770DRAFT_400045 [Pilaira anomala]|nr:hypothetical protein BD770DRAFT_400045 [Pilaira anomala]